MIYIILHCFQICFLFFERVILMPKDYGKNIFHFSMSYLKYLVKIELPENVLKVQLMQWRNLLTMRKLINLNNSIKKKVNFEDVVSPITNAQSTESSSWGGDKRLKAESMEIVKELTYELQKSVMLWKMKMKILQD